MVLGFALRPGTLKRAMNQVLELKQLPARGNATPFSLLKYACGVSKAREEEDVGA
jgi:hypothetical protein